MTSSETGPSLVGSRFQLDLANQRLLAGEDPVPLRPKTFDLLAQLAAHPGRLLTKESLLDAVWPETYITETVLKVCIHELRQALGDAARRPRFIQTVHGRGYRLVGEIARLGG